MKVRYRGKINYTMDNKHPDFKCVKDCTEDKVITFEDIYYIDKDYFWSQDEIIDYIKHDLKLVAGGGYNTDHIHNVTFEIKQI